MTCYKSRTIFSKALSGRWRVFHGTCRNHCILLLCIKLQRQLSLSIKIYFKIKFALIETFFPFKLFNSELNSSRKSRTIFSKALSGRWRVFHGTCRNHCILLLCIKLQRQLSLSIKIYFKIKFALIETFFPFKLFNSEINSSR